MSHSPTGRNRPSVFGRLPEDGRIAWCEVIVRQRGPTHSIESKPPHGVALATPADEKPLTTVLRQNVRLNCPHRLRTVPIHVVQRHDSTLFETLLDGLPVRARIRQNPAVTANPHAATELGDLATTLLVHHIEQFRQRCSPIRRKRSITHRRQSQRDRNCLRNSEIHRRQRGATHESVSTSGT